MRDQGLIPEMRAHDLLVEIALRTKDVDEALTLLRAARVDGTPSRRVFCAILDALLVSDQHERCHMVFELMRGCGHEPPANIVSEVQARSLKEQDTSFETPT
jgi:pentatricopeptide repeat protein